MKLLRVSDVPTSKIIQREKWFCCFLNPQIKFALDIKKRNVILTKVNMNLNLNKCSQCENSTLPVNWVTAPWGHAPSSMPLMPQKRPAICRYQFLLNSLNFPNLAVDLLFHRFPSFPTITWLCNYSVPVMKRKGYSCGGASVNSVLAAQVWGPEFHLQHKCRTPPILVVSTLNPGAPALQPHRSRLLMGCSFTQTELISQEWRFNFS